VILGRDVLDRLRKLNARRKARSFGSEFERFASQHFDGSFYLSHNPDVRKAGYDALAHWMNHGLAEGRRFSPELSARLVPSGTNKDPVLSYLECGEYLVEIRKVPRIPPAVLAQIEAQGEHDPILFGPGAHALANLPIHRVGEIGINLERLFSCWEAKPRVIFVIPLLGVGGGEKYAADICRVLQGRSVGPILLVVTDHREVDAGDWKKLSIIEPFRDASIVFWRDICADYKDPQLLASLLVHLEPELIVVTYSGIGLQALARYGRRIAQKSKIFCTFFSLGIRGLGAPYGVTFARQTTPFARSITDNEATAASLDRRFAAMGKPAAVMPPCISIVSRADFKRRLSARNTAVRSAGSRWVWVSRLDWTKGIDSLRLLAKLRPADKFDLYGPATASLESLGLSMPNICHRGVLNDVSSAEFSAYDGYLFTSPVEGMPNVVLEMSQHAIPLIISDAGGLRETFDAQSAIILSVGQSAATNAQAFHAACDRLISMLAAEKSEMVRKAYEAVSARHSPDGFAARVREVFGV
jgi:glycosyltransferase involved in cell wall biosynthesis